MRCLIIFRTSDAASPLSPSVSPTSSTRRTFFMFRIYNLSIWRNAAKQQNVIDWSIHLPVDATFTKQLENTGKINFVQLLLSHTALSPIPLGPS